MTRAQTTLYIFICKRSKVMGSMTMLSPLVYHVEHVSFLYRRRGKKTRRPPSSMCSLAVFMGPCCCFCKAPWIMRQGMGSNPIRSHFLFFFFIPSFFFSCCLRIDRSVTWLLITVRIRNETASAFCVRFFSDTYISGRGMHLGRSCMICRHWRQEPLLT